MIYHVMVMFGGTTSTNSNCRIPSWPVVPPKRRGAGSTREFNDLGA